ncbi:MAG: endonuclease III domain-containing protein [Candidatus Omnitrophota bacterium]
MQLTLNSIYKKLFSCFGPQHWWPGDTPFEVMVGAILTQNTNWLNVEKAIVNLKNNLALSPRKLNRMPPEKLARLIRPAGYYNIKAKRLKNFLRFFLQRYQGSISKMRARPAQELRRALLEVNGIGQETADSILLYALAKPAFVVDAYTKRILARHSFISEGASYEETQNLFMSNLKNEVKLYNEFHALLVKLGKEYCLKTKPRCLLCPLK